MDLYITIILIPFKLLYNNYSNYKNKMDLENLLDDIDVNNNAYKSRGLKKDND